MLDFSAADLLSYNHKSEFLGENNIRFKNTKEISVEGWLTNFRNLSGISGIITGISGFEVAAQDFHLISINNQIFGSGVITNISFPEGNDVQKKRYNVDLRIYETGASGNFPTGNNSYYSGINWAPFCEIESLNETISYQNNFDRGEYNHNINVKVLSSNITGSINSAKAIAGNLFSGTNLTGFSGQYSLLRSLKPTYTESYDLLNAECSFNKKIEILANITGNYSISKTYTFNRDEAGIINVSEKGNIKALQQPYIQALYSAANTEMASSFVNCSGIFVLYEEADNYNISNQPLVQGTNINTLEGTLDYEVIFTNNLNESGTFFWNYAHDFSLDEKGLIVSSENGQIVGRGNLSNSKYLAAVNGYNTIAGQISGRAKSLYGNFVNISNISLMDSGTFNLVKKNETFSDHRGVVEYSYQYSNDTTLSSGQFLKTDLIISNEYRCPLTTSIIIPGFMEVEQNRGNKTVTHTTASVTLRGIRGLSLDTYLNQAKTIVAPYAVGALDSVSYSFTPNINNFDFKISWPIYQ